MITRRARGRSLAAIVTLTIALTGAACTPTPPPTAQQQVDQIVRFVERVRGHEFLRDPVVTFASEAEFRAALLEGISAAEPLVDEAEPTFVALGWLERGRDLYDLYRLAFGGAAVGFYDPVTEELLVRGTNLTPYRREVIAHELTHALDDQIFGLDETFDDGLLGEQTFASLVAIEGSAVRVQQSYFASMSGLEQAQNVAEQLSLGADPALLQVPLALLSFIQAPYLRGGTFVQQVAADLGGGTAGYDAPLIRYPATAEQAFDRAKYLADEPAAAVAAPPVEPGGTLVRSGTWGQFLLTMVLQSGLGLDTVAAATAGWAGDAYVTWTTPTEACFRLDVRMDTDGQAASLRAALSSWAAGRPDANVGDLGTQTSRLTSCA